MSIQIVTDSASDLPKELMQKHCINVVPLTISHNRKTYLDGIDFSNEAFLKLLVTAEEAPKTSQPSIGTFLDLYDRLYQEDNDATILSIHMPEQLSGTVQAARLAAEQTKANVRVVDSGFVSSALGFQVIKAAQLAKEGYRIDEIVAELDLVRESTSLYCALNTLDFLVKGGRINKGKAFIGSMLKIKPIATLVNAEYTPVKAVRTYKQVLSFLKETFLIETDGKVVRNIAIVHVQAEGLANQLYAELRELVHPSTDIFVKAASPVISTHTGPGAIGLMYCGQECNKERGELI
ncbi:DegV family protein [Bacillus haynesii]|uniref:DegV family protein n=1 Tax=Bacillus haynesii TaxID=1925021 RepID=UPI00227EFA86|nr:DegV family protein [Bacillus haynesii]MCY8343159.1 DegV family protein [Bacillus haynesii]MCY9151124.1 DegV family protein [Bacillus haynesii]